MAEFRISPQYPGYTGKWLANNIVLPQLRIEMNTTKKMPSSLTKDGQPSRKSEFVIPLPAPDANSFVGLRTGKKHKLAVISYIGKSITVDDILKKIPNFKGNRNKLIGCLDQFIVDLQKFKVGNVISISYSGEGDFTINLEATRPKQENRQQLP